MKVAHNLLNLWNPGAQKVERVYSIIEAHRCQVGGVEHEHSLEPAGHENGPVGDNGSLLSLVPNLKAFRMKPWKDGVSQETRTAALT